MKGGMHFYRGSGRGAAAYFDEGHRGAEAYYNEQGRAAVHVDRWRDGERIASGSLDEKGELEAWVEGRDPDSGEVKGVIRPGGSERAPLRFVEVVVNNPKSLSIVASQNPTVAAALDRVLGRQADEIGRYVSRVAVARIGPRGAQVEVGGLEIETARVAHLTSREGDPHRHVHLMVNARVKAADGVWRGLHSVSLRSHIRAVNALGHRVLVTDAELHRVLAQEGYTLGADGEVDQARGAVGLLSKRRAMIAEARAKVEAEWRAAHPGREPSLRVVHGWDHQGWEDGRRAKARVQETPEEVAERVRAELAEIGLDFTPGRGRAGGWETVTPAAAPAVGVVSVGQVDRDRLAGAVVAGLSAGRSAWSDAELAAAVEVAVADLGVVGDPAAVGDLADDVAARARAACVAVLAEEPERVATSMTRRWTSQQVVDTDLVLNLGLAGLVAAGGGRDIEAGDIAWERGLDGAQADAAGAIAGRAGLEVVVGPAGTGKTAMLAAAKEALEAQGRQLVVVAPTRKAAQVAAAELDSAAWSLSKLLYDHGWRWDNTGRWSRVEVGEADPTGRVHHGPEDGSRLGAGSVVVVDEAGLVSVDQAVALVGLVRESGAQLRLVGDPRQLGAVGRGGVIETAIRWVPAGPVTLDQVHRFLTVTVDPDSGLPETVPDTVYAELSMRLREGVDPDGVAQALDRRGAVIVHADQEQLVAAIAEQVAGQVGTEGGWAVTVATNDDAAALNGAVRARRVAAGEVDDERTVAGMAGQPVGVGDRIITRRNDPRLGVANREAWTVTAVAGDGGLVVAGKDRRVELPGGYVAAAVQLGYAVTDYGNQGVTVDRSITWAGPATTVGGLYVGATRGRYTNQVHIVAEDRAAALDELAAAGRRDRSDRGLDHARQAARAQARTVLEDPARLWRTVAEFDAAATAIEARLAWELARLVDRPVMDPAARAVADATDRQTVEEARGQEVWHRSEVGRLETSRAELTDQARADYQTARDDARTIAAGPGRLHRRAGQVEAAIERRADTARRWDETRLPGTAWADATVAQAAARAVARLLDPQINYHRAEADTGADAARGAETALERREWTQQAAAHTNQENVRRRAELEQQAQTARERLAGQRALRQAIAAGMTPEQIAAADTARDTHLAGQAQQARQAGQARRAEQARRARTHDLAQQQALQRLHDSHRGPEIGR